MANIISTKLNRGLFKNETFGVFYWIRTNAEMRSRKQKLNSLSLLYVLKIFSIKTAGNNDYITKRAGTCSTVHDRFLFFRYNLFIIRTTRTYYVHISITVATIPTPYQRRHLTPAAFRKRLREHRRYAFVQGNIYENDEFLDKNYPR